MELIKVVCNVNVKDHSVKVSLLFDLDGTLLDTAPDFAFIINKLRNQKNLVSLPYAYIRSIVPLGLSSMVTQGFDIPLDHAEFIPIREKLLTDYREHLGQKTEFFPGIPELLNLLDEHQIPWGIVTNKVTSLTIPLLQHFNLQNRAKCIVCGDTTAHPKPHPEPLNYAANLIKMPKNSCIFIGDAESDIIAGKASGMTTLAALYGYITNLNEALQWGADEVIHDPAEIWPWLEKFHSGSLGN